MLLQFEYKQINKELLSLKVLGILHLYDGAKSRTLLYNMLSINITLRFSSTHSTI